VATQQFDVSTEFLNPQAISAPNTIEISHATLYAGVTYQMHIIGGIDSED
jgi:hypothetical protein